MYAQWHDLPNDGERYQAQSSAEAGSPACNHQVMTGQKTPQQAPSTPTGAMVTRVTSFAPAGTWSVVCLGTQSQGQMLVGHKSKNSLCTVQSQCLQVEDAVENTHVGHCRGGCWAMERAEGVLVKFAKFLNRSRWEPVAWRNKYILFDRQRHLVAQAFLPSPV